MLLGDGLGDIKMIEGFDYDNLIKIGFLNENVEENLEQYKRSYDVLILNDSSIGYVNGLLREIC
jgi:5'-nucleotidase